ncbi:MAG: thioredoxin domain-containing protein [Luteolibacter sp.]
MPNLLIHETSPYLLQHAGNPVDWLPWSEEAFERARAEDKLVFLSVGYSTCHWCHVMERETFENPELAAVMNHHFINIKVDREERPDIDAVYMAYLQATTGHGGWPMSVWLTPDGKPVLGGTYFPPEDRHGRAGFRRVCHDLARLWRDDRQRIASTAADAMEQLQKIANPQVRDVEGMADAAEVLADFTARCESMFDPDQGGFGGAPKFPRPVVLRTLMRIAAAPGEGGGQREKAWEMAATTLAAMADGGIRDHLGGGFHRYSVDRWWHVPHYEKMLYDQAQLADVYLDAWQISGEPRWKLIAEEIFDYLLSDMRDSCGAFHAAEDADSLPAPDAKQRLEGAFWTWTADEVSRLLEPREAAIFSAAYGLTAEGNARPESDPHGELNGRNTLYRAMSVNALANMFDCGAEEIHQRLDRACRVLVEARRQRPRPHRDDKIVSAWNGMVIGAMARAARLFQRPDLTAAAVSATEFIRQEMWDGRQLYRSYRQRRGNVPGFPADYACLIGGLIELHASTAEDCWLSWAAELQDVMDAEFWSDEHAAYLMRPSLGARELMAIRDDYDGAEPSPNHLAAENLLRLAVLTHEARYAKRAAELLDAGSAWMKRQAFACPQLLLARDLQARGLLRVEIPKTADSELLARVFRPFSPRAVFCYGAAKQVTVCDDRGCHPWSDAVDQLT